MTANTSTRQICPRCGGHRLHPIREFNALSRHDNRTRVCSPCGTEEAVEQFNNRDPWPNFPRSLNGLDPLRRGDKIRVDYCGAVCTARVVRTMAGGRYRVQIGHDMDVPVEPHQIIGGVTA